MVPSKIFALVTASPAKSAVAIVPSKIFALVTAFASILPVVTAKSANLPVLIAAFEITGEEALLLVPPKSPDN